MLTLVQADARIMAVSDGAASATQRPLERAGLEGLVEQVVSVDDVKRSKASPEVCRPAAVQAGARAGRAMLVDAQPWDIQGATQAGWLGAHVARGVPFPSAVMRRPDLEDDTLAEVAGCVVEPTP